MDADVAAASAERTWALVALGADLAAAPLGRVPAGADVAAAPLGRVLAGTDIAAAPPRQTVSSYDSLL